MDKTFIGVRDVDEEAFRKFRALAIERRLKLGEALTEAMKMMLRERRTRDAKPEIENFLKMRSIKTGKKVKWSEEVDEILYGSKK